MKSWEIREKFISFYRKRNHSVLPSVSIIPENDPSLLFVNSGMFPLVNYLSGEKHPLGDKLVNYQRCFRSDDIDEVGDKRHTTLFEMLGNWSLNSYFKEEQLKQWFSFIIDELELDINKIYQTFHLGGNGVNKDNETLDILKKIYESYGIKTEEGPETVGRGEDGPGIEIDFNKYKIFGYKDKNWWQRGDAVGELGGPDSETFYDTGKKHDPAFGKHCHLNCDCGRFIEIGNSVFMQYKKTIDGWELLKDKNVDFGGGLERLTMISEQKDSVFETDLFGFMIKDLEIISGKKYEENTKEFEVIADHLKAVIFIIGDSRGVGPSNKQQGYYVRRLIRRIVRYSKKIGLERDGWMNPLVIETVNKYQEIYPELEQNQEKIIAEINQEELKFKEAVKKGLKEFKKNQTKKISGKTAFNLYQTYGLPIETIKELAEENNQELNEEEFYQEQDNHKKASKTLSSGFFKGGLADSGAETTRYHTATHLLLAGLRKILDENIEQKGSNITSERMRFDFSYPEKITEEKIKEIESFVNCCIDKGFEIKKQEMSLDDAKKSGALSFFQEKYPEKVNVYSIVTPSGKIISREICHGPHVKKTSEIQGIKIVKEESIGSGKRRIKAVFKS